jgi:hypothetical protein
MVAALVRMMLTALLRLLYFTIGPPVAAAYILYFL